jgi:hypothetical protein
LCVCVCVCVCLSLSLSCFVATGKHEFCVLHVLLRWTLWETQKLGECEELFSDCCCSSENLLLFRYELLCSDCSSSQFIVQTILLLWIQIALLHNSFFRQFFALGNPDYSSLQFLPSENFALVDSDCSSSQFFLQTILLSFRIALHCIALGNFVLQKLISNHQCLNPFTDIYCPCLPRQEGFCV